MLNVDYKILLRRDGQICKYDCICSFCSSIVLLTFATDTFLTPFVVTPCVLTCKMDLYWDHMLLLLPPKVFWGALVTPQEGVPFLYTCMDLRIAWFVP